MGVVVQAVGERFDVGIEGPTPTRHAVVADVENLPDVARRVEAATLVRDSFEFLLEREPNTSILATFALSEIARYFPEYPSWLEERYGGAGAD